ncbi:DNA-binding transcriptional LysR family regulator [Variovorax sp. SG517]|uniref:LysR family transcriptional regulator n=1 Tax=Variovorax sp. SG517 TaxID=2587117 RepID=UPI00159E7CF6|nr:LysR family transcriptional regulator [Variovorax sp. SG517]NVM89645.1 DNA-binding transcriptional LysR family regulator [Variovorax sp. SG517]
MEFSDLTIFLAVVRNGGVVRAAEVLHRAQSSVTSRIQVLEEKLGVQLFLREGRRLQLSPAGQILVGYAERLVELSRAAANAVQSDQPTGVLRLGAMESTAAVRLPGPLGIFHERYPDVALELYSGDPRDLVNKVLNSELDAALIADPVSDHRLETMAIYDEELVIIAEAKHGAIASPKDLPSKSILAFHPGCPHRKRLEDWFARGHVMPERIVEVGSYHLILGCVAVGMGVALVPHSVLDTYTERARLSVHKLRAKFGRVKTRLVWRREAPQAKILALSTVLLESHHKS